MGTPKTIAGNLIITPTMTDTSNLVNQINKSVASIIPALQTTYTIAQLNALTGVADGQTAYVSNGLVATGFGNAVAGTGAAHLPVHYDATLGAWRYG